MDLIVRHAETLGDTPLTVTVVATAGQHRRDLLWEWTAKQLAEMGHHQWADLFRIAHISHAMPEPIPADHSFFLLPRWVRPFDDELYPLIEGGQP